MLTGTEAPAQMQVAFRTIHNTPLVAPKPAPLTCWLSAELTILDMSKATDMKQNPFRIGKGMFMCTTYADALGAAGDLLSATAAQQRISIETIRGFRLSARRLLAPAALISAAKQHDRCLFSLTHSLPER